MTVLRLELKGEAYGCCWVPLLAQILYTAAGTQQQTAVLLLLLLLLDQGAKLQLQILLLQQQQQKSCERSSGKVKGRATAAGATQAAAGCPMGASCLVATG
jgi:hypothetical protein